MSAFWAGVLVGASFVAVVDIAVWGIVTLWRRRMEASE